MMSKTNLMKIFFISIFFLVLSPSLASADLCDPSMGNPTDSGKIISHQICPVGLGCKDVIKNGEAVSGPVFIPTGVSTDDKMEAKHYKSDSITMYYDLWRDEDSDGTYETQVVGAGDTAKTDVPPDQSTTLTSSGEFGDVGYRRYHYDLGEKESAFSYNCLADVKVNKIVSVVNTETPEMNIHKPSDTTIEIDKETTIPITVENTETDSKADPEYPALDVKVTVDVAGESFSSSKVSYILEGDEKILNVPVTLSSEGEYTATVTLSGESVMEESLTSNTQSFTMEVSPGRGAAETEIDNAEDAINQAERTISRAQSKINNATDLGGDVTDAQTKLDQAQNKIESAKTHLSSANSSFQDGNYDTAKSEAIQAQDLTETSQTYATEAKNLAEQAIQGIIKEKNEAENKISDANSAIDTAKTWIEKAENITNDAKNIGLDTADEEGDIATARVKVGNAEDYLKEANNAFDQSDFDKAKQKATTSESKANRAENLASSAYSNLEATVSRGREAADAIGKAKNQIAKMNRIADSLQYIVDHIEAKGVDLSKTKSLLEDANSRLTQAEDLVDEAQNYAQSGSFSTAAQKAIAAKNKIDEPLNRLDTISETLKEEIETALQKKINKVEAEIQNTRKKVKSAANTYGADSNKVVAAQNNLSKAESELKNAKSTFESFKKKGDVETLVKTAKASMGTLEKVEGSLNSASQHAQAAKNALYQKIAAAGAAIAAAGGGFLYWRRRKGEGESKEAGKEAEEVKSEETIEEETDKESMKYCTNCGEEVKEGVQYCPECGEEV